MRTLGVLRAARVHPRHSGGRASARAWGHGERARVRLALIWFPSVVLLVDRLGRWLRRPRTARAIEGGSDAALTALGLVLVTGPLVH